MESASPTVLESYYHTPTREMLSAFPIAVRAGHLRASSNYRIERSKCGGHDLLFCLAGAGSVRVENCTFAVRMGELVWLNGYHPHAHWADPAQPWELLWFRIDGMGLEALAKMFGVAEFPVFRGLPKRNLARYFREILREMRANRVDLDFRVQAHLAGLFALLRRGREYGNAGTPAPMSPAFARVINRLTLYPQHPWSAHELAKISGMSVPSFYRRFHQLTGSAPIDWLRRERISLAKRRLLESEDFIKVIADQCGYNSAFFFSRDFKKYTGVSPSEFRRSEGPR